MSQWVTWGAGILASAVVHVGVAGIYLLAHDLAPAPQQSGPQSELQLDTVAAPRQDAVFKKPSAEQAHIADTDATNLDASSIPQSEAQSIQAAVTSSQIIEIPATFVKLKKPVMVNAIIDVTTPTIIAVLVATQPALTDVTPKSDRISETLQDAAPLPVLALHSDTVPVSVATQPVLTDVTPKSDRLNETLHDAAPLLALAPPSDTVPISVGAQPTLTDVVPKSDRLNETLQDAAPLLALAPPSDTVPISVAAQPTLTDVIPKSDRLSETSQHATPLPALAPQSDTMPASATAGTVTPPLVPEGVLTSAAHLPATSSKATTAWQFQDRIVSDPTAIATIQAFMAPTGESAEDVKDNLSDVLSGINCARLSATYIPETGALEIRGHIPDPALLDKILNTMQAQVGEGIQVTANLLHLPSPQCEALTGISAIGLPQSTDQFTNRRLIGQTAHARKYNYTEGQRLQFDLAAPDYDSYVYVDYFAADGSVTHLVPNNTVGLSLVTAETLIGVGIDRPGQPGLKITIGPPFGQEIAVAFAASQPLYEGYRPIVEPAEPYLAELKGLVSHARASNPDFKGEWVYFFITTSPNGQ
jgi:hypothetical protein